MVGVCCRINGIPIYSVFFIAKQYTRGRILEQQLLVSAVFGISFTNSVVGNIEFPFFFPDQNVTGTWVLLIFCIDWHFFRESINSPKNNSVTVSHLIRDAVCSAISQHDR